MLNYLYAGLWFVVGIILILRMGREHSVFYPIGGFFLFLGVWWYAAEKTGMNLFVGTYGVILRLITAAVLILSGWVFFTEMRKNRKEFEDKEKRR